MRQKSSSFSGQSGSALLYRSSVGRVIACSTGIIGALVLWCFFVAPTAAQTTVYWDTNGNSTGAGSGTTATGTWDQNTTANWSTNPTGSSTGTWQSKSGGSGIAVFAAGTGATGVYTVTVGAVTGVRGITFEEGTVTLSSGSLALGGTSTINTNATTATIASTISGATFGINKTGSGTLILSGNNTFTGGTQISAGTVQANSNTALGTGALTLGAGTTIQGGSGSRSLANAVVASGDFSIGGASDLTFSSTFNLGSGNRTINVANTGVTTISGVVSNGYYATTTKTGTGTLVLSGANTFTGSMVVSGGILRLQNSSALGNSGFGNSVASGAELQLLGGITVTPGDFSFQGTGVGGAGVVHNISGANTLGGQLTFANASTVGLDAGSLTFSGTVALSSPASMLTTTGAGDFGITGAVNGTGGFIFGSSGATNISGVINASGTLTLNGSGTVTLSGTNSNNNGAVTINNGTLVLAKSAGVNASQGNITVNSGTLRLGASNQIPDSGTVTLNSSTALFDLNGFSETLGNLLMNGSTVTTGAGTLGLASGGSVTTSAAATSATISGNVALSTNGNTFSVADGAAATDLNVSATISGSGGVTKTGAGLLVLSGANTYTGPTTLAAGTLSVGTIGNGGVAGNLGQAASPAGNLVFDGGTLQYTGATASTNRNFTISTGKTAVIDVTANTLTISGATGPTSGGLTKTGAGTLTLSGTNQYTGVTTISAGTLSVATIGDGGAAGNLGQATSAAGNLIFDGGALRYTGGPATTNRNFTISAGKTATIDVTTDNLTLSGAAAATTGSLNKTGAGTLTLSGANAFTGGVTVSNGTLVGVGTTNVGGFAALGNYAGLVSSTTVATVNSGATLTVQSSMATGTGSTTTTALQNLTLNGSGYNSQGALRADGGINTWTGNITLGSDATITNAGAAATNGTVLYLGAWTYQNTALNLNLNGNDLTLMGPGNIAISSMIGNAAGDTGSVTLIGSSTTRFTYAGLKNYYTGATNLNSGILRLQVDPGGIPAQGIVTTNTAIRGDLTIGTGSASTTATAQLFYSDQIADNVNVTINSDGILDLGTYGKTDTIGHLVMNGGTVSTIGANQGVLKLGGVVSGADVNVTSAATSTIGGRLDFNNVGGATRTIEVASGSTLAMTAQLYGGSFIKDGAGTMIISSDNSLGYGGTTQVKSGILNIQNANALGQIENGTAAAAQTTVDSGATLQLQSLSGNIAFPAESLVLNGAGANSLGALNNLAGNNSWQGGITLGSNTTIKSGTGTTLTVLGSITGTGTAVSPQTLTVGGLGNTTLTGAISNGSGGGSLGITKVDSGTLTLNAVHSFTGAVAVNGGTLALTVNNALGAQTNTVAVASGGTLAVSGGNGYTNTISALTGSGLVTIAASTNLKVNTPSADTFDGRLSGAGLFEKAGAGTFTFSSTSNTSAFNFAGTVQLTATATTDTLEFKGGTIASALTIGTLKLTGGTLLLTNSYINVGTLNITGDTILDFGTSGASILNANNIYIATGVTLTVKNWDSEVDFLFANSDFRQNNSGGTLSVHNVIGTAPENQVKFVNAPPYANNGSTTTWIDNATNYYSYADNQIRPVPEPSTYGLIFLSGCASLLLWRRSRTKAAAR